MATLLLGGAGGPDSSAFWILWRSLPGRRLTKTVNEVSAKEINEVAAVFHGALGSTEKGLSEVAVRLVRLTCRTRLIQIAVREPA